MRTLAAAVLGLVVTASAAERRAFAEPPPPSRNSSVFAPRPASAPGPARADDVGLGPKQFGLAALGTMATVGVGLGLTLLTDDPNAHAFVASAVVAPGVAGLVICGVGTWSLRYEGRCGAAVVGAYLGALGGGLTGLLLGLSTCSDSPNLANPESGPTSDCGTGIVVASAIGYLAGTTVGGLIGWTISRQPKVPGPSEPVPVASGGDDDDHPLVVVERPSPAPLVPLRGAGRLPRTVVFPIVALAF